MVAIVLKILGWTALVAALILWPAGSFAYPGAWTFIALFALGGLVMVWWLSKHSPSLLRERMASPFQRDQKPWDRVFLVLFILAFVGWLALMGWDARRAGFAAVPPWLQVLGGIGIVLYMLGNWWTFRENTFAAPVVKIQEGQRVVDTGPYAIVRHPMYASALFLFIGVPLLLGSWLGLAFSALFILGIAWRAVQEERTLRKELQGYEDYIARVRYRFIPFVW
jgi:protein-S-isoprenylcysteine O-methyltransferase Ste14